MAMALLYAALAFGPAQGSQESDPDALDCMQIDDVTALIGVRSVRSTAR